MMSRYISTTEINHLTGITMRLEFWSKVIQGLDIRDKNPLLPEFVQKLAATALVCPYIF